MIFNNTNNGSKELRELLGFIDSSTNFDKWKTWIGLSVRQITQLTGTALYTIAENHYKSANYENTEAKAPAEGQPAYSVLDELVHRFQLANALFAYVRLLPSLDAGHSNGGRKKTLGDTERALTAVEAYKDESNILNLAYEAMEALIEYAETNKINEWITSPARKTTETLLIQNAETFNQYFRLNSVRMFYTLVPMISDVQRQHIAPATGTQLITDMLAAQSATTPTDAQKKLIVVLKDHIRPAMVASTMALALERLPIEIFPEGLLQTQVIGTVKEKLAANEETRKNMIASFTADFQRKMSAMQDQISLINGTTPEEVHIIEPKPVGSGFRF